MVGHASSSRSRCAPRHWPWPIFFFSPAPAGVLRGQRERRASSAPYTHRPRNFSTLSLIIRERRKKRVPFGVSRGTHGRPTGKPLSSSGVDTQPKSAIPCPCVSVSVLLVAGGRFGEERGARIKNLAVSPSSPCIVVHFSLLDAPPRRPPPCPYHLSVRRPLLLALFVRTPRPSPIRRPVALLPQTQSRPSVLLPGERSLDECGTYSRSNELELPQWQRSRVSCIAKGAQAAATMVPL
jgi:hypothetical protein